MEIVDAIGKKLELGIYRTSKPIKEEEKKSKTKKKSVSPSKPCRSNSSSPVKSPEPHTQRLLVKSKEKQCFAEAKVEKRTVSREAAHKTVSLPSSSRFEKVSLSVKIPVKKKEVQEEKKEAPSTCAHIVEQKLTEIAKQAEELAKTIRRAAELDDDSEDIETETQNDVDSVVLDFEDPTTILRVEVAPPVVKASESLSLSSPSKRDKPSPIKVQKTSKTVEASDPHPRHTSELQRLAEATRSLLEIVEDKPVTEVSDNEMNSRRIPPAMSTSDIRSERQSLTDRLSRGIQELTHGSTDRLQKWKTKLNSSGRLRKQEQSAPPPSSRPMLAAAAPTNDVIFDWAPERSPRPLHTSKSATNALQLHGKDMEHRTLRSKENSASQKDLSFHYQHMNSLQKMMSTFDGYSKANHHPYDLPPPAKITPHSGVKPTHEDIIRPIAFRPLSSKADHASHRQSHDVIRLERPHVIRGDLTKSASNLSQMPVVSAKPRMMYQPSTSYSPEKPVENEYDTVPDYIEKEKFIDFGSSGSDYGSFTGNKLSSSTASSGSSHLSSPPSISKKIYPLASTGRSSSGVHVTPSPSDSGIMDIETVIRDKENELREVRTTMEHNEEVIVKVYQEKERAWKEEIDTLRTRLAASERGENALRAQLAGCQRQTETISRSVDGLREEKSGLLRKCFQLERELNQLKTELEKPKNCPECQRRPIPAPRSIKENDSTIRTEVSSLRDEVATLKEALNGQIQVFNEERKKWEGNSRQESRDRLI